MSSLEALWTVEYETAQGWENGGVVVLETGRVFGGDSQYYYVGTYTRSPDGLKATIRVKHYFGAVNTAFGDAALTYEIIVVGSLRPDGTIVGRMARPDSSGQLPLRMTRRAELP